MVKRVGIGRQVDRRNSTGKYQQLEQQAESVGDPDMLHSNSLPDMVDVVGSEPDGSICDVELCVFAVS